MSVEGSNQINGGHLRAIVERIEAVERNIKDEQEARKEIYAEAKSMGFDPKILRKAVAIRKQDKNKVAEEQEILDLYMTALLI